LYDSFVKSRCRLRPSNEAVLDERQEYFGYGPGRRSTIRLARKLQEDSVTMSQLTTLPARAIAAVLLICAAFVNSPAAAASDADAAALKQATATCKAQVKEQAQYKEISLYARHKMVKQCVKDALAAGH
jgi:hypothetical protein